MDRAPLHVRSGGRSVARLAEGRSGGGCVPAGLEPGRSLPHRGGGTQRLLSRFGWENVVEGLQRARTRQPLSFHAPSMAERESNRSVAGEAESQTESPCFPGDTPAWARSGPGSRRGAYVAGVCVVLFVVVAWAFWPALRNDFLRFDDSAYVTANAQVQSGLSWESLIWALGHPVAGNWHPLTVLSHMVDCQLYGLKAWGHHLTSVLLHAVNAVLVFLVFWKLTRAFWRCAVLAALFGLHPLRVESVAWVAERKDVLSTLFWLLTMLMYVRYVQRSKVSSLKSRVFYCLTLVFFALGLMSKPMVVTLPFVLLLLDYWPLNRFELKTQDSRLQTILPLVREKLPFFGLAAVCSVVTWLMQSRAGALATDLPLGLRVANALISYGRYLGKTFWPVNLAIFYPNPVWWPGWQVLASVSLLLVISAVVILAVRSRRYLSFGWLWFCGTLVPVIGLVQVGNQSMADRYTYVPLIGLFVMLVWGAYEITVHCRHQAAALSAVALMVVLACMGVTRRQISHWRDDESVWQHALAIARGNDLAHLHLGIALGDKGRLEEAVGHFEEAIRLRPQDADAYSRLAYALAKQRRLAEAVQEYEKALRLNPANAELHNDLALTLARQGRAEEAIEHYTEALRLKAGFTEAHYNLGLTLAGRGQYAKASAHFQAALRLDPKQAKASQKLAQALAAQRKLEQAITPYREAVKSNPSDPQAHRELGRVLLEAGQVEEAVAECAEAARLEPRSAEAQYQLGAALARKGETEKAARQFELALELDPTLAAAHYALGIICQQRRLMPEALKHWREALRLAPRWADPLNNLAWALATDPRSELRDGVEAVELALRAVELAGTNHVGVLDTLAAAYAEAGRFGEASATARQAQAAALAQGQAQLAEAIGQRLALYDAKQPCRTELEGK